MQLFYSDQVLGEELILTPEETHHALKVLRMREGDNVNVTDGQGFLYQGIILQLNKKNGIVKMISSQRFSPRSSSLHIAIAPTKNIDRFEWFLEKACEFGIERITPIICGRSERKEVRTDRLNKILIAGMKQSLHYYLPVLDEPVPFTSFVAKENSSMIKCIAHCEETKKVKLNSILSQGKPLLVLIGPEGDFIPEEINVARHSGFIEVSLGSSRLRTETAGIAVAHSFAESLDI